MQPGNTRYTTTTQKTVKQLIHTAAFYLIFFHHSIPPARLKPLRQRHVASHEAILLPTELFGTPERMMMIWLFYEHFNKFRYRNIPKFSDRQVWANSVDPDQTAPRSLIRVYTVCNSLCIFWMHYSTEKSYCSTFRVITANFRVSEILRFLRFIRTMER